MRVYMLGGVLAAAMSGAGVFGLTVPPHEGGAVNSQVVLIHHAAGDEGADDSDLRFDDCTAQQDVSDSARLDAEAMGARFREHGFVIQRVLVSPSCHTVETAKLMKLRPIDISAAFQNVRGDGSDTLSIARLDAARKIMNSWRGSGVLVVVTHGSTIKALTGLEPQAHKFVVYHNNAPHRAAGSQEAAARLEMQTF